MNDASSVDGVEADARSFSTRRLDVHEWRVSTSDGTDVQDLPIIVSGMLTEAVTASLPTDWHGPFTLERARRWILERDRDGPTLLARERGTDRAVGLLIVHEERAPSGLAVDVRLGYLIAEDAWGAGFGGELVQGFVAWCRGRPEIRSLAGGVAADNVASIRILEQAGFVTDHPGAADASVIVYRLRLRP